MKRLALLLAAMGIVSVGAMAEAPTLKVISVGQEIEIENQQGKQTFDESWLFNNVTLGYGDWTFSLQAGKMYSIDLDNGDGMHSEDSRLQIDVWKKMSDNLKLGARYRGYEKKDRWYGRWDYANNWFWSAGDVWYEATNEGDGEKYTSDTDWVKAEVFPLGFKYKDLKVGYFLNYEFTVGSDSEGQKDEYTEHQIRLYYPLYKGEKFSLNFEGRFTLSAENGYVSGKGEENGRHYDDFGRTRLYLKPSYKVSDSLTVYGYYAYEWRDWEYEKNAVEAEIHGGDNYQDIGLGWTYTF